MKDAGDGISEVKRAERHRSVDLQHALWLIVKPGDLGFGLIHLRENGNAAFVIGETSFSRSNMPRRAI